MLVETRRCPGTGASQFFALWVVLLIALLAIRGQAAPYRPWYHLRIRGDALRWYESHASLEWKERLLWARNVIRMISRQTFTVEPDGSRRSHDVAPGAPSGVKSE